MADSSSLVAHVDSGKVTFEGLKAYAPPEATPTWKPISHYELVGVLKDKLADRGYSVAREEYAVSKNGAKLFGIMDLQNELVSGVGKSIGFRHANDKSMGLDIVAGGWVFVCDNMALCGKTTVVKHKHTWGLNIGFSIHKGLVTTDEQSKHFARGIERASGSSLTPEGAGSLLASMLYRGVITHQVFQQAYELYFQRALDSDEFPDCQPRTVWALHNAFTRVLKEASMGKRFRTTIDISKELGIWN